MNGDKQRDWIYFMDKRINCNYPPQTQKGSWGGWWVSRAMAFSHLDPLRGEDSLEEAEPGAAVTDDRELLCQVPGHQEIPDWGRRPFFCLV